MRPLEQLLFGAILVLIGAIWWRSRGPEAWRALLARILALAAVAVVFVHLSLEGYRWQMVPAYVVVIVLAAVGRRRTGLSGPWLGLGVTSLILALVVAIALPIALPVPRLPEPDGPFAVGTFSDGIADPARAETYGEDEGRWRELMIQVWYPAVTPAGQEPAPYIANLDIAAPLIAERIGAPPFLLASVNQAETHAYQELTVAPDGPFPILIFVHGLGGVRMQNSFMMEHLASHGYIVAAMDHTYGAAVTIFEDGRVALFDPDVLPDDRPAVDGGRQLIDVWSRDVAIAYSFLKTHNRIPDSPLNGQVNADALGVFGHSTGGGTAVDFCAEFDLCRAGIGLDAWVEPLEPDRQIEIPFLFASSEGWLGPENRDRGHALLAAAAAPVFELTLANTAHFDYSDLPLLSPLLPLLGLTSERGVEAQAIISDVALAFFDRFVRESAAPTLEDALSPYAGVDLRAYTPDP